MQQVVVICGPTGVGKSEIGVALAELTNGEVISADSRSFFRGLDIGTDKPSPDVVRRIPHHLIDIVEFNQPYDVMHFRGDVDRLIKEIDGRGRMPLIVGGGTLYLRVILQGIFQGPSADTSLRQRLSNSSLVELYTQLQEVDPIAAARIHPHDRHRIIRALEVHHLTGRPISELQQEALPLSYDFYTIGLRMDKELHRQILKARIDRMLDQGLLAEAILLKEKGIMPHMQTYRTIGYEELFSYIEGKLSFADALAAMKRNTIRLARRQLAWFQREAAQWIDVTGRSALDVAMEIKQKITGQIELPYIRQ
ncbi:tRNA (adenosine(37)-N6)-dimethylallyltransferase MiaA [Candidatus Acetothermia bacterium]|jgi:tRNA dimethylallyltransferase|nr:tRNA (adenosine(37)-N6)-dimethylallyltransferase MiaA [Candidatus Acetothermia bacterium]MCI2426992.1 tRNA (adenosine(37)-N6)-dimethylallyltransferase MiaA [Candidatus Acetothermia bacterium]MCI2428434.1 tRNA (adenosine(37)-N6)-dimethylallyltransferase MiaA [Candidatus Acetothermia bacterium]